LDSILTAIIGQVPEQNQCLKLAQLSGGLPTDVEAAYCAQPERLKAQRCQIPCY
jgi:hypothetical protein